MKANISKRKLSKVKANLNVTNTIPILEDNPFKALNRGEFPDHIYRETIKAG